MPPKLRDMQQAFGDAIFADDVRLAEHVVDHGLAAADRLRIYRNTAFSVLTDALRLVYPVVSRIVGSEFFDGAAAIFIRRFPPKDAYLGDYGAGLAGFLAGFEPAASIPYLADVARFEWALNVAANAADAAVLNPAALNAVDTRDHPAVRFIPHGSLSLLRLEYPADTIADAVMAQDDAAMAAVDLSSGPIWLVVHRGIGGVKAERLTEREWRLTESLCSGWPLAIAAADCDRVDTASLLGVHLAKGRFAKFVVSHDRLESPK